ncbi:MAG: hypothetical protein HY078_14000 [Elusimicrobia bacterium]|nr:hypothetical protein [Elusimicrobiota bacterium]
MSEEIIPAMGHSTYRDGLARAMDLVWKEKLRHRVISEAFFALDKLWIELRAEKEREEGGPS